MSAIQAAAENYPTHDLQAHTNIPVETLRALYLPDRDLPNGTAQNASTDSTTVTFPTVRTEYPAVKKLNPLNKKRILVTGVCPLTLVASGLQLVETSCSKE